MVTISINDDTTSYVLLSKDTVYKLVSTGANDFGSFTFSGVPAIKTAYTPKAVYLDGVPHTGQVLFVDVNDNAGALTRIKNKGSEGIYSFTVQHPDIIGDEERFGPFHEVIKAPKPFEVVWDFYDPNLEGYVEVTVSIRPLPSEHAVEVSFTTK
jgi:hypothetical protein